MLTARTRILQKIKTNKNKQTNEKQQQQQQTTQLFLQTGDFKS